MFTRIGVAVLAVAFTVTFGTAAQASDGGAEDQIADIVDSSPGLSRADLLDSARAYAAETDTPLAAVLAEAGQQARDARTVEPESRSSGGGTVRLSDARNAGDVFWDHSSFPAGHVGIYTSPASIVEAPGPGTTSHHVPTRSVQVHHDTRLLTTTLDASAQDRAAGYARSALVGHPYNLNFAFNKGSVSANDPMNCSQLVWYAYRSAVGLDLDSGGGPGVYPSDIYYSRYTTEYARVA